MTRKTDKYSPLIYSKIISKKHIFTPRNRILIGVISIFLGLIPSLAEEKIIAQQNEGRKHILKVEMDFARLTATKGIRVGFINNLDSTGIVVNGIKLVNGFSHTADTQQYNLGTLTKS